MARAPAGPRWLNPMSTDTSVLRAGGEGDSAAEDAADAASRLANATALSSVRALPESRTSPVESNPWRARNPPAQCPRMPSMTLAVKLAGDAVELCGACPGCSCPWLPCRRRHRWNKQPRVEASMSPHASRSPDPWFGRSTGVAGAHSLTAGPMPPPRLGAQDLQAAQASQAGWAVTMVPHGGSCSSWARRWALCLPHGARHMHTVPPPEGHAPTTALTQSAQ